MAAHVLTAINQILEDPEFNFRHLPGSLSLSCWTEDLDMDDYRSLSEVESPAQLEQWARDHEYKYRIKYKVLGSPETREQWQSERRKQYLVAKIHDLNEEWDRLESELMTSFDTSGIISRQDSIMEELHGLELELSKIE